MDAAANVGRASGDVDAVLAQKHFGTHQLRQGSLRGEQVPLLLKQAAAIGSVETDLPTADGFGKVVSLAETGTETGRRPLEFVTTDVHDAVSLSSSPAPVEAIALNVSKTAAGGGLHVGDGVLLMIALLAITGMFWLKRRDQRMMILEQEGESRRSAKKSQNARSGGRLSGVELKSTLRPSVAPPDSSTHHGEGAGSQKRSSRLSQIEEKAAAIGGLGLAEPPPPPPARQLPGVAGVGVRDHKAVASGHGRKSTSRQSNSSLLMVAKLSESAESYVAGRLSVGSEMSATLSDAAEARRSVLAASSEARCSIAIPLLEGMPRGRADSGLDEWYQDGNKGDDDDGDGEAQQGSAVQFCLSSPKPMTPRTESSRTEANKEERLPSADRPATSANDEVQKAHQGQQKVPMVALGQKQNQLTPRQPTPRQPTPRQLTPREDDEVRKQKGQEEVRRKLEERRLKIDQGKQTVLNLERHRGKSMKGDMPGVNGTMAEKLRMRRLKCEEGERQQKAPEEGHAQDGGVGEAIAPK